MREEIKEKISIITKKLQTGECIKTCVCIYRCNYDILFVPANNEKMYNIPSIIIVPKSNAICNAITSSYE